MNKIQKFLMASAAGTLMFGSLAVGAFASFNKTDCGWNLTGSNSLTAMYLGSPYTYNVTLTQTDTVLTGSLTDTYFPGTLTAPVNGIVTGSNVNFTFDYGTAPWGVRTYVGTIDSNGNVIGTWSDNGGDNASGTWTLATVAAKMQCSSFVNAGDVPTGSKLVVNVTYKVTNDEDSGFVGYWALDNYNKHLQVWQTPTTHQYYAVAWYDGKWQTFAGALSPELGSTEGKDASGTFQGGYTATFNATSCSSVKGNIGPYDFGGTKADVLLGTYGAGQTGSLGVYSALTAYCPGYTGFNYNRWGWTYHYRNQTWYNFDNGSSGDIVAQ